MKKFTLNAVLIALVCFLSIGSSWAQFEGVIKFDKIKSETTQYTYYVKGKKVRVEETGSNGVVRGIMLVDLDAGTVVNCSPERKLYMDYTSKRPAPPVGDAQIEKTKNKKTLFGYECTEYIVKSDAENTEIRYWIAEGKFDFFRPLLKTLNRKDKMARYFMSTDTGTPVFTMVGTETNMDGSKVAELKVTSIEEMPIDDNKFVVPAGYQKFEK